MGKVGEKMGRRHTKLLIKLYSLNQGWNRDFYFWGSRLNYHIDSQFMKNSKYHTVHNPPPPPPPQTHTHTHTHTHKS